MTSQPQKRDLCMASTAGWGNPGIPISLDHEKATLPIFLRRGELSLALKGMWEVYRWELRGQ